MSTPGGTPAAPAPPAPPSAAQSAQEKKEAEKLAEVNKELESKIARWVSGLVVPVVLPVSTIISFYLQKWLHFKLDAGSLAAYLSTIAAGVSITAYKWVSNRGDYERALLEIVKLHELGKG